MMKSFLLSALARDACGATARGTGPRRPLMCLAASFLADSAIHVDGAGHASVAGTLAIAGAGR